MFKTFEKSSDAAMAARGVNDDPRGEVVNQLQLSMATANADERQDCATHLRRISEAAQRLTDASGANMSVLVDLPNNLEIDAPRMTALGFFVGEAILNALRHAHPSGVAGEVRLCCRRFGGDVLVSIEDDGVGLPVGFDPGKDGGLGYGIMRELAERLKARVSHQSTALGLRVEILFAL